MLTIVWDIDDVLNDLMRDWFTESWLPHASGVRACVCRICARIRRIACCDIANAEDTSPRSTSFARRRKPERCSRIPHLLDWFALPRQRAIATWR